MRKNLTMIGLTLLAGATLADPPMPAWEGVQWEYLGSYVDKDYPVMGSITAFMDASPFDYHRDGNIVRNVPTAHGLAKVKGRWQVDVGTMLSGGDIDCAWHTYRELWFTGLFGQPRFNRSNRNGCPWISPRCSRWLPRKFAEVRNKALCILSHGLCSPRACSTSLGKQYA